MTHAAIHRELMGTDAGPDVSAAFAMRFHGASKAQKGKHLELTNRTPNVPGYRERQARKLWIRMNRGLLGAETAAAVRRDYAKEFSRFAKEATC